MEFPLLTQCNKIFIWVCFFQIVAANTLFSVKTSKIRFTLYLFEDKLNNPTLLAIEEKQLKNGHMMTI